MREGIWTLTLRWAETALPAALRAASPGPVDGALRWPVTRFQYPPTSAAQTVNRQV